MTFLKPAPITVVVTREGWTAVGPETHRSRYLYNLLVKMGGISETVPPGTYHFNTSFKGFKHCVNLTPVTD